MDVLWNETPQDRWQALMDQADAPFQQSWTYGEVARSLGANVHRIELLAGGRTLALAQGIERWFLRPVVLFTMGPVWIGATSDNQRRDVLQRLRRDLRGSFLGTPPDQTSRTAFKAAGMQDVMTSATLANLSLAPGLRDRMHVKWRNRLTTASKQGVEIRRSKSLTRLNWLLDKDRRQQKQRRYRALPTAFTRAWQDADPNSVTLLTADTGSDPMAAMLFLSHGSTATYHIGWTSDEGRAHSAHHQILALAADHFADQGVRRINLGLIDTENTPGLARFKLGAGASPKQTGGTWFGF